MIERVIDQRRRSLGGLEVGRVLPFVKGELSVPSSSSTIWLGGEPLGQRLIEWNFVSTSRERIEQAKVDWRAGRMKLPDLDHDEWIPLPPIPCPRSFA